MTKISEKKLAQPSHKEVGEVCGRTGILGHLVREPYEGAGTGTRLINLAIFLVYSLE